MKRFRAVATTCLLVIGLNNFVPETVHGMEKEAVRIAVIDTGISSAVIPTEHLEAGRNYIFPNRSTEDNTGHGTAVAGIITGTQQAGVHGLSPRAKLVPLVYHTGIGGDAVRPYEVCSEAEAITFLWRALGRTHALTQSEMAAGLGEHDYTDAACTLIRERSFGFWSRRERMFLRFF